MRSSSRFPMVSINSNSTALSTSAASIFCMARTPSGLRPFSCASVTSLRNTWAPLSPSSARRISFTMMSALTADQVAAMLARIAPAL